jgi:hypothetical protein
LGAYGAKPAFLFPFAKSSQPHRFQTVGRSSFG